MLSDLLTGIIIAAVSIPISMGYAQIAGLPGGIWIVWVGVPDHNIWIAVHAEAVRVRCGCALRAGRSGTGDAGGYAGTEQAMKVFL